MTDDHEPITGGCLCGAVRYRLDGPIQGDVAHCHCSMCRRAAGSVAVTWFTVAPDSYTVTRGTPARYQSSEKGTRTFCGTCGTPLTFFHADHPEGLDVTVGSLDRPEDVPATQHIWTASRLPWLKLDPHLPDRVGDS